jgi:energy-coupling factor transporter transmembrane protein EcfT
MATTDLHVLRCLPWTSPVHRLWAGTKLLVVAALGIAVVAKPTWAALGVVATVVLIGALASRYPLSALPRLPHWFLLLLALGGVLALTAGGAPEIEVGDVTIGLGGVAAWARFTALGIVVFALAILLGATTPVADLPGAVERLCAPARRLRLPVDELVGAFTLVVRAFPLVVDEMRTLYAAWRLRRPVVPRDLRALRELHDAFITALAAALRRAHDLARAIDARGGVGVVRGARVRLGAGDAIAFLVTAIAVVAVVLVP